MMFLKVMLSKLLSYLEDNFLQSLGPIRLDADECDIENTVRLSKLIMEEFFRTQPNESILRFLPIDEDKLVPLNKLSTEIILYWSLLQQHLLNKEDLEGILERILPDLPSFCNYIERFMTEREQQKLEGWKFFEYQFILLNLFGMTGHFDLSEEMDKQRLHQLVITTLMEKKLEVNHVDDMVVLLEKTVFGNLEQLISDTLSTKENEIEEPSPEKLRNINHKLAQLKVKRDTISDEVDDAILAHDINLANLKQEQVNDLQKELDAISAERSPPVKVYDKAAMNHRNHRNLDNPMGGGNADIIESMILMLDNESRQLRDYASVTIGLMLCEGIIVSPTLLSRLHLKLYNPLTEKENPRMCRLFRCAMIKFAYKVPGSADIVEQSIIQTLTEIGNAPKMSPLADINIDEIIKFFCFLTSSNNCTGVSHKRLAYSICNQISKNIDSKCVPVWLKMLLILNPPKGDKIALKELKTQVLIIIKDVKEKFLKERLRKYISILDSELKSEEGTPSAQITDITFNKNPDSQTTATNRQTSKEIQIISDIQIPSLPDKQNAQISECQVIADVHFPSVPSTSTGAANISEEVKKRKREKIISSNLNKKKTNMQEPSSTSSEDNKSKAMQKGKKQKVASSENELLKLSTSAVKDCTVITSRFQGVQHENSKSESNSQMDYRYERMGHRHWHYS